MKRRINNMIDYNWSIYNNELYTWSRSGDSFHTQDIIQTYKDEEFTVFELKEKQEVFLEIYMNSKLIPI